MGIGLLGKKLGMTQIFDEDGCLVPITVVKAGPCVVVQKKTLQKDGYNAIQLGFEEKKRVNKPLMGHFKKAGNLTPTRYLREFRDVEVEKYKIGEILKVDIFSVGEVLKVTGTSKGKGFAGIMKRHHARGGRASRGSMFHRASGSIGASSFPSKVTKGKHMPGRMGGRRITVLNKVIKIDIEKNILLLKGPVPGANNSLLLIQKK